MTNGSHPPKKPTAPIVKKSKGAKPRKDKSNAKAQSRLAVLMAGNA